ncbi:MAG: hypothetical protein AAGB32_02385 [Pseudomonadota bacterium]
MFEAMAHGSHRDPFDLARAVNDFLDSSGYTDKHMIRARPSSDTILGTHVDIAILDDDKAPSDEEREAIITGLQESLSKKFGVKVEDAPEFLRTIKGRIPRRGSAAFERLNPKANARYIELAGL